MKRLFITLLTLFALAAPDVEAAKPKADTPGIPVKVSVLSETNEPIPTAVIRHPDEADRHRVNSVDGTWEESVLYLPDGTELIFEKGMLLLLEVSAPGYETQVVQYQVRRRRNFLQVNLKKLNFEDTNIEEPMISFGRDTPREDGAGGGPAN